MNGYPFPIVDVDTVKDLLLEVAPDWSEFLDTLESSGGRLEFREELGEAVSRLNIGNYPRLYENEAAAGHMMGVAMLGAEGLSELDAAMASASPTERGAMLREIGTELEEVFIAFDLNVSADTKASANAAFNALSPDEQVEAVKFAQRVLMVLLAVLHQQLSIMVHGEKLSALISRAKLGDDAAFLKAIQIDKRILSQIPYFDDRFQRAHMRGERPFITAVSRKLEAPPYAGRIEHKKLWLAFSLLDGVGLLDACDGNALLDLLHEVGVVDDQRPIYDVKNLHKLKARYRAFQALQAVSTP